MSITLPPAGKAVAEAPAPVTAPAPTPSTPRRERLLSLDVFRGLTVAGMLLVNDPGTWSAIYPPLEHATWNGWTPTDLVFPFFLFIVGITTHLSLSSRRARGDDERAIRNQILRRGALIFLIGFLMNGFPYFAWGAIPGIPDPTFGQRVVHRLLDWRIMGVLQRIGLAYIIAALLTQRASVKRIVITAATLLIGYFVVMTAFPVPPTGLPGLLVLDTPSNTMAAYWDRFFLNWSRFGLGNHIWISSRNWDPEGILSTIPAAVTGMLGVLAGRWIASPRSLAERLNGLFAAGALVMMAGMAWNWVFPINKSIWTSSYVLFCGGMAAIGIATTMWIVDVHQRKGWTKFFVVYGTNPLIAFAGSGVLARCIYTLFKVNYQGKVIPVQAAIYRTLFQSWLSPVNASLAFAIAFVLFWYVILDVLHRKGIYLKV